jgi:hypothetical protein
MLVREGLAIGVAATGLMLLGCSSSNPRDINIDTDVGVDFTPPDGGSRKDGQVDGQVEESGNSVDNNGGEASVDELQDVAVSDLDAPIDGSM